MRRLLLRLAVAAVLVTATVVVVTTSDDGVPAPTTDLAGEVRRFAAGLDDDDPYRPPRRSERRELLSGLRALEAGASPGSPAGFSASTGVDRRTGRPYGLLVNAADERAWGWYLVDRSAPVRLVIEVPHPNSDLRTEEIGLALYQEVPGSMLLVAGTHRRAADVAHRDDSMFHAVARAAAGRGLPQVQLHGFHDDNLPDTDVVISPGAGDSGEYVRRMASRLDEADFRVCRSWQRDCGRLEGKTNEQGQDAARQNTPFAHVEISRSVRDDREAWYRLVGALSRL